MVRVGFFWWFGLMILAELLGDIPPAVFLEQSFLRLPFSRPQGAARFCELGSWRTIETILAQPDPDVLVVRRGARWAESGRVPTRDEARQLHADGYTLLVRHAERHVPGLAQLADGFARELGGVVDVHLYCTPGGEHGFGWHYDAEDVFILQTEGRKEYALRKNTVNPWPLMETLPADMQYEREQMPLMKCLLGAGDWLYIPNGYWHRAAAPEPSISLAAGVLMPAAVEVYDTLRRRLLDSLLWRQRLPVLGEAAGRSPAELMQACTDLFAILGDDLARLLSDPATVRAWLSSRGIDCDDLP